MPEMRYTFTLNGLSAQFVVFRHEETSYTITEDGVEHDIDLIAAVPCGKNLRKSFTRTEWWHTDEIDGASLEVVR